MPSSIAYFSFDTVPAPKGAATHIEAFKRALARAFGVIELVTVASARAPGARLERWPGVFHTEIPGIGVSLIDRVISFRRFLEFWLAERRFDVVQFRSIFEGLPLLRLHPRPRLVFEVNGLPSIELKHRYPRVVDDRELTRKLMLQEQACLDAADRIVTPSAVTARYLGGARGVDPAKIRVIPNGVDPALFQPAARSVNGSALNLLYFGTLSSWQGVDLAVRATAQICRHTPASLTVLSVGNNRQREQLAALSAKLGIAQRVEILPPVEQAQVAEALHRAFAVLAPLPLNDRNLKQGCCPLKILEGMAAGVPVIASDLPVVRELGEHASHLLLVKPGSVDRIAQAVLDLHADPDLWRRLAVGGREHIRRRYTWDHAGASLAAVYAELGMSPASRD